MGKLSSRTTTKFDLARQVASECQITVKVAEKAVDVLIDAITRAVKYGNRVEVRDFGVFHRRKLSKGFQGRPRLNGPVDVFSFKTAPRLRNLNADHR